VTEHREIADLLPGFALGSLDIEDERGVREHLAGCTLCRRELASLRRIVGELAAALPPSPPPPELEARIMSALHRARPRSRPRRLPILASAALAMIAALGAGNIVQWQRSRVAVSPRGAQALVTLTMEGRGSSEAAFGTVVLDPEDNEGVVAVRGLPALGPSRAYQLWLIKSSRRASGGLFSVDAHGYGSLILDVPPGLKDFDSFLVTTEPMGGSAAPTTGAVMEGHR
jgi:anti-sigma-K factor RskA